VVSLGFVGRSSPDKNRCVCGAHAPLTLSVVTSDNFVVVSLKGRAETSFHGFDRHRERCAGARNAAYLHLHDVSSETVTSDQPYDVARRSVHLSPLVMRRVLRKRPAAYGPIQST